MMIDTNRHSYKYLPNEYYKNVNYSTKRKSVNYSSNHGSKILPKISGIFSSEYLHLKMKNPISIAN